MITKQINAVDASIYLSQAGDFTDWEESNKKLTSEVIGLLALIGVGIFVLGFFLGACVIIKCKQHVKNNGV